MDISYTLSKSKVSKSKVVKLAKRQQAFALFDKGFNPSSPEIKKLGLKYHTRHNYYWEWQKERGVVSPSSESEDAAKRKEAESPSQKPAASKGKTISELEMVVPPSGKEEEEKEGERKLK